MLREVGGPGQRRLNAARVLVVGAGGLGVPVLMYLAAAGVGHIQVIDDDVVSRSNLQRQVMYRDEDIGQLKVDVAARFVNAQNPHVHITPLAARFDAHSGPPLLAGVDLVIDGCDDFTTRQAVNAAAVGAGVPLLSGAITQWEGQISLYDPVRGAPCYQCLFDREPAQGLAPSCAEAGVMGALPGVVGAMMAGEAIKELTGAGRGLRGRLLMHDALWGEGREIKVVRRQGCKVCGHIQTAHV
ncbi:molybdopterin-synthase adenylyltransferase MoeB [Rhodobacteraceae bacterium]|nr:molybdopterin-synthase adenylyltransferase MoeB [Paracoccaceae bacterium]